MRIWHLIFATFLAALALTVGREPAGRVALIVFTLGLGWVILGTSAVMALFRTVGAIGHANTPMAYVETLAATALVLVVATLLMDGLLWLGLWLMPMALG